jgi:hypothetical protein
MDEFESSAVHENYFRAFSRVNDILAAVQTGDYADTPRRAVRLLNLALTTADNGLARADQLKNDLRTEYVLTNFAAGKYFRVGELLGDAIRTGTQYQGSDSQGVTQLLVCRQEMRDRVADRWDGRIAEAKRRFDAQTEPDRARTMALARLGRLYQRAFRPGDLAALYRAEVADEAVTERVAAIAELGADECGDHGEADSAAALSEISYGFELARLADEPANPDTTIARALQHYTMGERYFAAGRRGAAAPLLRQAVAELADPPRDLNSRQYREWTNIRYLTEHLLGDCHWIGVEKEEANRHYRAAYRLISEYRNPRGPTVANYFNSVVYSAGRWQEFLPHG